MHFLLLVFEKFVFQPFEDFPITSVIRILRIGAAMLRRFWPDYDSISVLNACQNALLGVHSEAKQSLEHSSLPNKIKDVELRLDSFTRFV